MFNAKSKSDMSYEKSNGVNGGATLISAGTTLKGDINSSNDLRIDGTVIGNICTTSKIIIGNTGAIQGDIECNQADITGKVNGNIKVKDLVQLKGECNITGNVQAGKLQVEPTATFNGQCHMAGVTPTTSSKKAVELEKEAELN
jgi:cytoskeletal protein CcmA (bactofilin family)